MHQDSHECKRANHLATFTMTKLLGLNISKGTVHATSASISLEGKSRCHNQQSGATTSAKYGATSHAGHPARPARLHRMKIQHAVTIGVIVRVKASAAVGKTAPGIASHRQTVAVGS